MRTQFQRLKLKCDEPLSSVAFNFNLSRYMEDPYAEPVDIFATPPEGLELVEAGAYTRPLFSST
jgi:hypothetical protein